MRLSAVLVELTFFFEEWREETPAKAVFMEAAKTQVSAKQSRKPLCKLPAPIGEGRVS
jgi:hypothetical protein